MEPLISIVIPVFNAAPYLRKCLESVINQTYKNLQIICVDDGSTDNSAQILIEYAERDTRFIAIHKKNEGVSLTRNAGLDKAKGEYILFVDGDDWIEPDTCDVAVHTIQKHKTDVVMWSYVRELPNASRKKNILESDTFFDQQAVKEKLYRRMVGLYGEQTACPENADALCTVWGKLYRRCIIEAHNIRFRDIHEIGTYEDGLFNLHVFSEANSAVFINRHLYHYRRSNRSSITSAYNARMPQQWNNLFDILYEHIDSNKLDETFFAALNNRIVFSLIALGINETEKHDGLFNTIGRIKQLVQATRYQKAMAEFDFCYLPIHWKLYFIFAKLRFATGIYLLLFIIQKIRGR